MLEKKYPLPEGERPSWAGYSVRDRMINVVDAVHRASILRSRVSSHRMHSLTRSLTIYDVVNVQGLARSLLMDALGYDPLGELRGHHTHLPV